jgi:CTD small phosphatase-like protein 2
MMTKDLRIFKNVPLSDLLLVDNCTSNFVNQLENGVPIIPYLGNMPLDVELVKLGRYLKDLAKDKSG